MKYLFITIFILSPLLAFGHPGNTASDGYHYCWTNCSSWGEVYGQRHSHGGYSTSYTPTTYVTSTYKTNSDCPSYGFAYLGECYQLPGNSSQSYYSGFDCDYGYESVGYGLSEKCVPKVDNGYYIGTALYCSYGYTKYYNSCIKESNSSTYSGSDLSSYVEEKENPYEGKSFTFYYEYDEDNSEIDKKRISSSCKVDGEKKASKPYFKDGGSCYYCNPGYITDKSKESCIPMENVCSDIMGTGYEIIKDGRCGCKDEYKKKNGVCVLSDTKVELESSKDTEEDEKIKELEKLLQDLMNQLLELQGKS